VTGLPGRTYRPSSLRIALLCYRGNPHCGGQGVYARHLSRALLEAGHSVTVFSGQPYPQLESGVLLERVPSLDLYRDVDPFRVPRLREISSLVDLAELTTMWTGGFGEPRTFSWRVTHELAGRRADFDVVHDNHGLGGGLLGLVESGWPVIASVHHPVTIDRALDLRQARTLGQQVTLRRWYGFARMQHRVARRLPLITVSESAKRDVIEEIGVPPEQVSVVPLGVDEQMWRPLGGISRTPGLVMTTASADVALKGLPLLLEAVAKLRTERDGVQLVVVGRPRDGAARAIERFGLDGAVSFVEGEEDESLVRRYAEASVAVVPSLYEGFSLPAVEAMACAVPLVVTTGGALPEVVGDAALSVPPGDAGALASAIARLLDDSSSGARLGERARQRAISCYSWRRVAEATADQYRAVIESPC
jgi:glycosyltransferase involved in cell wall biosynthesis